MTEETTSDAQVGDNVEQMPNLPDYYVTAREYDYIPKAYKDLDAKWQAVFHLKRLTQEQQAQIDDMAVKATFDSEGNADAQFKSGTRQILALKFGLRGWTNFRNRTGEIIPYSDEAKKNLSSELWRELASSILRESNITSEERENLK